MKTIEIIVSPDGAARVETKGFAGPECRAASNFVEKALGNRMVEQLTGEFCLPAAQSQPLREGA